MKRLLLYSFFILNTTAVFSQTLIKGSKLEISSTNSHLARFYYDDNDAGQTRPRLDIWGTPNKINLRTTYGNGGAQLSLGTHHVNDALLITNHGQIGIGTTSPGAKLHVNGDLKTNTLLVDKPNRISDWNDIWQSGFFESVNGANVPEGGWFWGINFNHGSNHAGYRYNGQLIIKNQYTSPTMYFRSTTKDGTGTWTKVLHARGDQHINGTLAIGTTKTNEYRLSVGGKIRAEEVKVYTGWADFVFQEGYILSPLSEVALFIKENQHLPNIPSEAEVLENGIDLGAMDAKLLQKIEELTLYTIEQENQLAAQQASINIQKEKLAEKDLQFQYLLDRLEKLEKQLNE